MNPNLTDKEMCILLACIDARAEVCNEAVLRNQETVSLFRGSSEPSSVHAVSVANSNLKYYDERIAELKALQKKLYAAITEKGE